ncbi:MAG: hypothetical protein OEQ12_03690 [Nitrosopumilus sp.]|nr:hypothetical protein [Nitrosopumilus sp.]
MNSANLLKLLEKKKKFPKNIRLYFVSKKHRFINDGIVKDGFGSKLTIQNNRDSVLSAFSKMAFVFDEIIRLRIVGYSHNQSSDELMYLLHLIPVNRKIRTFLDWKIFSPEYAREMSRLFMVRSATMHCVLLNEVQYIPNKRTSLSEKKGFTLFTKDMTKAWKNLLDVYVLEQEKISLEKISKDLKL